MKYRNVVLGSYLVAILVLSVFQATAADKGPVTAPLTPAGEQLQAKYAGMLAALQAELNKALANRSRSR